MFSKERYEHPHSRVNQQMDCLDLKAKGYNEDICNNVIDNLNKVTNLHYSCEVPLFIIFFACSVRLNIYEVF